MWFNRKLLVFLVFYLMDKSFCLTMRNSPVSICEKSQTTVSGTKSPKDVCAGQLIFEDDFKKLDFKAWKHENTLSGAGNWEFQWYTNNRSNSYVHDGILFIKPTLTADTIGEENLSKMTLDINGANPAGYCTDMRFWGCNRAGTARNILNPIKSAKLTTVDSFSFKYGRLEVRAKMPTGDWLWPAIWLMPRYNVYGTWPSSGEIDLVESRGNEQLKNEKGVNIGTEQISSNLHWGPYGEVNANAKTHFTKSSPGMGFNKRFRNYELLWTPDFIKFIIDGEELGTIEPKSTFWKLGDFDKFNLDNPWKYGTKMAPFDDEFFIVLNLAVGGTNGYWSDFATNPTPKPWSNKSPMASADFWNGRNAWLPSWKRNQNNGEESALQIDYVKVWAL